MAKATKSDEQKIEALREELRHHEHLYYVLDAPEWTDAQYDARMNEFFFGSGGELPKEYVAPTH